MGKSGNESDTDNNIDPEELLRRLQKTVIDLKQQYDTLLELPILQEEIITNLAKGESETDPNKQLEFFKKALELAETKVEKTRSLLPKDKD